MTESQEKRIPVNVRCRIILAGNGQKEVTLLEILHHPAVGQRYYFQFGESADRQWLTRDRFEFVEDLHDDLETVKKIMESL